MVEPATLVETDTRLGVPWTLVAVRVPASLKIEMEAEARRARRTLSAEMRLRLASNGSGERDLLRLVMAAVRARVAHEQIEALIKCWEE